MRQPSAHPTRNGGFLHVFSFDEIPPAARPQPIIKTIAPASVDRLHDVFVALLREHLVLSESHRTSLRQRGLSDAVIEFNGYRSAPTASYAANVARALARDYDLTGVPGFYRDGDAWRMVDCGNGFFVPVRDHEGRICGMQIRRDEGTPKYLWFSSAGRAGGASSGAPVHFAKSHLLKDADEVTITEGALKSDIAAHLLGAPVIGIAGVSTFGEDFAADLKEMFPKLRRVAVAFDMDVWHKPQVASALDKLITQLERARFSVRVHMWEEQHKGIDDYLVAKTGKQEVAR